MRRSGILRILVISGVGLGADGHERMMLRYSVENTDITKGHHPQG